MRAVLRIGLNVGSREPSAQESLTAAFMRAFQDSTRLGMRTSDEWQGLRERSVSYAVTYPRAALFQESVEALARALRQTCIAVAYPHGLCWHLLYADGALSAGATFQALPLDAAELEWLGRQL